ncbi:hypothetical protein ACKKBF_B09200 [Auxenochlorella protothecoides x Auxenochlorella symbiontica]
MTRFHNGDDMVQIAYALDLPPCIVARRLLEALRLGLGRAGTTLALRDPAALPSLVKTPGLADTLLARLRRELEACVAVDAVCCPRADSARARAGSAYEERLYASLHEAGVAFWTEGGLRARGFFKTPDAKLQVPVAVGGRVVHWIDSKATFGDARMHRTQLAEQYELYVNRFGPGMVIYWHGYVEGLLEHPGVLVVDDFPAKSSILQLPCLSVEPVRPSEAPLRPAIQAA